ncbi:MAG: SGNH/GDSL hydrolase family protein [Clostridia bacterium]|nr:SGNH/GDSL hydrolase family protein [Clostridia bacterium]
MKILFQGDSITDCYRSREVEFRIGMGYALLCQAELMCEEPNKYEILNRGVSGNRVCDLYARIKSDIINLKPDFMSILIGVNDVWHELGDQNGVDADKYYKIYSMLIEEVKEALPDIKIMIMEPFALKGRDNEIYWDEFKVEVAKRGEMAKKIAEKFDLPFVPLQKKFDEAAKLADNSYWLVDGVHPTAAGHMIIKKEWMKAFKELNL